LRSKLPRAACATRTPPLPARVFMPKQCVLSDTRPCCASFPRNGPGPGGLATLSVGRPQQRALRLSRPAKAAAHVSSAPLRTCDAAPRTSVAVCSAAAITDRERERSAHCRPSLREPRHHRPPWRPRRRRPPPTATTRMCAWHLQASAPGVGLLRGRRGAPGALRAAGVGPRTRRARSQRQHQRALTPSRLPYLLPAPLRRPRRRHRCCSITSDFLAQFNKEKTAIEGTIDAVMCVVGWGGGDVGQRRRRRDEA
jgi:hypothetical protein